MSYRLQLDLPFAVVLVTRATFPTPDHAWLMSQLLPNGFVAVPEDQLPQEHILIPLRETMKTEELIRYEAALATEIVPGMQVYVLPLHENATVQDVSGEKVTVVLANDEAKVYYRAQVMAVPTRKIPLDAA